MTHTHTHWQTQTDFIICPIAMGQIIKSKSIERPTKTPSTESHAYEWVNRSAIHRIIDYNSITEHVWAISSKQAYRKCDVLQPEVHWDWRTHAQCRPDCWRNIGRDRAQFVARSTILNSYLRNIQRTWINRPFTTVSELTIPYRTRQRTWKREKSWQE